MGQALYRKYRSKSFSEIVGQEHITKTLSNAIATGKISHAYLFTGPRGVGKTSVARILAHAANGFPYQSDSVHLDIIEIDAASNRRIDEIRDLRDKVNIAPAEGKYKVYIIDEVHMLTREAFNALLKTLEEPPAHCIFILATTEAHKLPDTIISRTQRFEFMPITQSQAAKHLSAIAKEESIDIEPEALELLAEYGRGSFRDSISYLDQLSSFSKRITGDDVRALLGLPPAEIVEQLLKNLELGDMSGAMDSLKAAETSGAKPATTAAAVSDDIRRLAAEAKAKPWQVKLLGQLLKVAASPRPQEALEIAILDSIASRQEPPPETNKPVSKPEAAKKQPALQAVAKAESTIAQPARPSDITQRFFSLNLWDNVLDNCKQHAASIYTALRLAEPSYDDGTLSLGFKFPLHQKKLEQAKNKDLVVKIIEDICGEKIKIKALLIDGTQLTQAKKEPAAVANISNIFGGAEVVDN